MKPHLLAIVFMVAVAMVGCGGGGGGGGASATATAAPSCIPSVATVAGPLASGAFPLDGLYANTFALRPLSADAIPTVCKPSAKATSLTSPSYVDPVYGTYVYRATAASDFTGATSVRHDYSRRQAWNSNNTRYIAQASNGYWLLYDASTFTRLNRRGVDGALFKMAGDAEPIWNPNNPNELWYTTQNGGLKWYKKNVETDTPYVQMNAEYDVDPLLVDFTGLLPWPGAKSVWTKAEGTVSANGCRFGFMATSYDEDSKASVIHGIFAYDRCTGTILGTLDASAFDNAFPDHVSISPSGNYVVPSWAYNTALGTRAYPVDFSSYRKLLTMSEHSDLAMGPNGEDYYVVTDYDSGFIVAINMATGDSFNLVEIYARRADSTSYAAHISGQAFGRPGWVAISTYSDSANNGSTSPDPVLMPMYRKIMLVELKPGGKQLNVAHTRVAASYGGYGGEPQVSISRDGSRLMFASNFNDGGEPSSYMIALPSWIYN